MHDQTVSTYLFENRCPFIIVHGFSSMLNINSGVILIEFVKKNKTLIKNYHRRY